MKFEYSVCEGFSIDELIKQVENALEDGWRCQGGVSVTPYEDEDNQDVAFEGLIFHQAIIKQTIEAEKNQIDTGVLADGLESLNY